MSPVDFKKWPCRPVKFKGQGPHSYRPLIYFKIQAYLNVLTSMKNINFIVGTHCLDSFFIFCIS